MKKLISYLKHLNRQRNFKTNEFKRRLSLYQLSRHIDDKRNKPVDIKSVKRILFPFVDLGIGDAVCHTGTWAKLKQAGYTLQVIVEERNRSLFEKIKDFDEIYVVDLKHINLLPKIETDLVISHYSWMKRKELFNVQLLQQIHYKHAISFGGWLDKPWNLSIPVSDSFHITHPQRDILKALNIHVDKLNYALSTPPEHVNFVTEYLEKYKDKKNVVINPFASVDERSLSLPQLEKLTALLTQRDNTHVFIVGEERKLSKLKFTQPNVSVCIFNSLWDTVALLEKADLVISVDTAIVHIACALDKKLIAIYYSMLLDHNEAYKGNVIFAPIGDNSHQLIFDKHHNKLNIEKVYAEAQLALGDNINS